MRQIILDTETTGLRTEEGNRIVEIGCVELIDRRMTDNNLHIYINPQRDSEPEALKVHGLTTEFLSDKPTFAAIADKFLRYIDGAELIIHNAPFDCGFLNHELSLLARSSIHDYCSGVVDTLKLAKDMFPGKRNSLDSLCQRYEINNAERSLHGALLDAKLLANVYIHMTRGQNAFLLDRSASLTAQDKKTRTIDLSQFKLPVIHPSEQESAAHEETLQLIDKASNQNTIWRSLK